MDYHVVKLRFKDGSTRDFRVKDEPKYNFYYNIYHPQIIPFSRIYKESDPPTLDQGRVQTIPFRRINTIHACNWHVHIYEEI